MNRRINSIIRANKKDSISNDDQSALKKNLTMNLSGELMKKLFLQRVAMKASNE
jgi:hypothetical protein